MSDLMPNDPTERVEEQPEKVEISKEDLLLVKLYRYLRFGKGDQQELMAEIRDAVGPENL